MQPQDESPKQQYEPPQTIPSPDGFQPTEESVVSMTAGDASSEGTTSSAASPSGASEGQPLRWQATEYMQRERDLVWFVSFAVITLVLIAVAVFIIKSFTFAVLVPIMAMALIVYTRRPPSIIDYTLSRHGLYINDRLFPFTEFKSFSVIHAGDEYSIMLVPTKRFKPGLSIYFPEEAGETIVDALAGRMPMQDTHLDIFDRILQRLHL